MSFKVDKSKMVQIRVISIKIPNNASSKMPHLMKKWLILKKNYSLLFLTLSQFAPDNQLATDYLL